jgi:hypothetical protein
MLEDGLQSERFQAFAALSRRAARYQDKLKFEL